PRVTRNCKPTTREGTSSRRRNKLRLSSILYSLTESISAPQYKLSENGIGLGLAAESQSIFQAGLTRSF
ncbi:MAG: hypothetical protein ACHQ1H_13315, partial [Nitrososphaerales archaeon]